jgi:hypothetical protein
MCDVYAKLRWAEKHLADLMDLAHEYFRPGGGDERPLGIQFDNSRPPVVLATFTIEKPVPVEIGLHAGDLVQNARTAFDHVLARLKDHFGGDGGGGTFPITQSDADWKVRVYPRRDGKRLRGPLDGLPCSARILIYRAQPHVAYAGRPQEDPTATLSAMDNADKHRLLYHGFAYLTTERGVDLIEVRDRKRLLSEENVWTSGQPIEHGTVMARYCIRGDARDVLHVDRNAAEAKLSTGPLDAPNTTYEDMIARVRTVADKAAELWMPSRRSAPALTTSAGLQRW